MARPNATVMVSHARGSVRVDMPESGVYGVVRSKESPAKREPWSAFAAHDAKNMLGVLSGNITWLREAIARGASRAELEEAVTDLETSVRRLNDIVRDALPRKPQHVEGLTPRMERVTVSRLLQAVYQQVRRQASVNQVTVEVRIGTDVETKLDAGLMERVLINLVDNALRFAPPRSTVRIGCDIVDDRLELTVTDEGPGVDKVQSERIFEPYFTTAAGAFPGEAVNSGLGLAFCRAVARCHGGDARAEPRPQGGYFIVELPVL